MNPNGQQPSNNPYDFILNSEQNKKSNFSGGSQKQRIIIVAIIGTVLLIVGIVVFSILSNAGKPSYTDNINIVRLQRKLIQVSGTAVASSPNADTRSYASTLSTSLISDNQQMESLITKGGQGKLLESIAKEDSKIQESLQKAASNNNFDAEFKKVSDDLLGDYVAALRAANSGTNTASEKALLDSSFKHIKTIVGN